MKNSCTKRKGNASESDKSDSDDGEHCCGMKKKSSAKRQDDESNLTRAKMNLESLQRNLDPMEADVPKPRNPYHC